MNKINLKNLAAILLPVLAMGIWIGSYLTKANTGSEVTLKIRGYDPRDLLSGHYLRYTVDYGSEVDCPSQKTQWCLCLTKKNHEEEHVINYQKKCHLMSSCPTKLMGQCEHKRFTAGIEKYYFPEQYKRKLRVAPPDSKIIVSLSSTGKGIVTQYLVKNKPLLEWLQLQNTQ